MTFTKEQLLNQARENVKALKMAVVQNAFKDIRHAIELDLALAELALAGMEAERVGVTDKSEIECLKRGEMANVMPPDYKGCDSGDSVYLYDAPQPLTTSERAELENYRNAQQVVPEPLAGDIDADDHPLTWSYHNGWNSCRAAMLHGKADAGERLGTQFEEVLIQTIDASMQPGNSPVAPDGWVACSERMPEEKDIVLVVDDGYFVCEAQHREGDFYSAVRGSGEFFETTCRDVEFWQPMPAAPQQEAE